MAINAHTKKIFCSSFLNFFYVVFGLLFPFPFALISFLEGPSLKEFTSIIGNERFLLFPFSLSLELLFLMVVKGLCAETFFSSAFETIYISLHVYRNFTIKKQRDTLSPPFSLTMKTFLSFTHVGLRCVIVEDVG